MRRWIGSSMLVATGLITGSCGGSPEEDLAGTALGTAGAHEHGVARLDLAVDGSILTAELEIPGLSAFGFEHEPSNDDERASIERALDGVERRFAEMLVIDPDAACSVAEADADVADGEQDHAGPAHRDEEHADHADPGAEHTELRARVVLECERGPGGFDARLEMGTLFPAVEYVDLQVLSSNRQFGRRVDAKSIRFQL